MIKMSKDTVVLAPKKKSFVNPKDFKEQPKKPVPQRPTVKQLAQSKVIMMSDIKSKSVKDLEALFNTLLNTGFRPILVNNTMTVFVRVIQVPIQPKQELTEDELPS